MWLLLAFLSAALLGFYDVFKKKSLRDNAVLPVLFLNTLFSSLIFLPFILYLPLRRRCWEVRCLMFPWWGGRYISLLLSSRLSCSLPGYSVISG